MQPQARRTSPALIRGLMALAVVAFFLGVMANAAQAAVLSPGYYQKVLKDENAYDRAYAELPADNVLAPFSSDLLGGVQVPVFSAVPGLLKAAIAPSVLEAITEAAIKDLIAYLKKHKDLELKLDITDFVNGVPGAGILTAGTQIAGAPTEESPDIDSFKDALDNLIGGMSAEGRLPETVPTFDVPPGQRDEVTSLILTKSGVDDGSLQSIGTRAAVTAAVSAGATDVAIKATLVPMLADVSADAKLDLAAGKFVQEEQRNGQTRYVLAPPPDVVKKIDDSLFAVQLVAANAFWLRPAGAALFLVALGAVIYLSRGHTQDTTKRAGIVLAVAGIATVVIWLVALPLTQRLVIDAAFEGGHAPSAAFDSLARDVLRRCVSNLTPYVFLPGFVAAGIGVALVLVSRVAFRSGLSGKVAR